MTECGSRRDVAGRAGGDDSPTILAGTRADVDQVVGLPHHGFVMFDDQHAVAQVSQVTQRIDQTLVVARMQADGRFIQDIADSDQARSNARRQAYSL